MNPVAGPVEKKIHIIFYYIVFSLIHSFGTLIYKNICVQEKTIANN